MFAVLPMVFSGVSILSCQCLVLIYSAGQEFKRKASSLFERQPRKPRTVDWRKTCWPRSVRPEVRISEEIQ